MDDQNTKLELKDKFFVIFKEYKGKSLVFLFLLLLFFSTYFFLKNYEEKKNYAISEKFIEAGLNLRLDNKVKSTSLYKEIILSENKFYSPLALNSIIEQKLETDKDTILEYFQIVEGLKIKKDQKDLIIFKKALYLIKEGDEEKGKDLLVKIIETNSKMKSLAEDIISK